MGSLSSLWFCARRSTVSMGVWPQGWMLGSIGLRGLGCLGALMLAGCTVDHGGGTQDPGNAGEAGTTQEATGVPWLQKFGMRDLRTGKSHAVLPATMPATRASAAPTTPPETQPATASSVSQGAVPDDGVVLRFHACGHLYGKAVGGTSPPATLARGMPRMIERGPRLLLSLGDVVRAPQAVEIEAMTSALQAFPGPVFNAPGNHDESSNRETYMENFGRDYGAVRVGSNLFLFFNTVLPSAWQVAGEQLEFLRRVTKAVATDRSIDNVFCCGHHVLFFALPAYPGFMKHTNAVVPEGTTSNFGAEVLPLLAAIRTSHPEGPREVVWLAGDLGETHTIPMFFHRDEATGVVFAACGIADSPGRDAFLEVDVRGRGQVSYRGFDMLEGTLRTAESFGPALWRQVFGL